MSTHERSSVYILPIFRVNSDEEQLVEELPEILSKQRILLLNLAWFGLSLMFLLMSVEGKFYHKFFFLFVINFIWTSL